MLQYALLHLFGYALSIDDLKNFRVRTINAYPEANSPVAGRRRLLTRTGE